MSSVGVINGYDFSKYASSDPSASSITKLLPKIGTISSSEDAQAYIAKVKPGSPITGDMVIQAAQKNNVDPAIVLAVMQKESQLGTDGSKGSRGNNFGNVGNTDSLMAAGGSRNLATPQDGVNAVAQWMAKHKVGGSNSGSSSSSSIPLNDADKNQLAAVIKKMESENYQPDQIKKVVQGFVADHKSNAYNPTPYSSGAVKEPGDDLLNTPGLTIDSTPDANTPGVLNHTPFTSHGIVSDEPSYSNVKNPVTRAVRQTAHDVKENTIGVGKSILDNASSAGGMLSGLLGDITHVPANNLKLKSDSKIIKPTSQAQSSGYIGSQLGQLLTPLKESGAASNVASKAKALANPKALLSTLAGGLIGGLISKASPVLGKVWHLVNPFD